MSMRERIYTCPHGFEVARISADGGWLLLACVLCEDSGRHIRIRDAASSKEQKP